MLVVVLDGIGQAGLSGLHIRTSLNQPRLFNFQFGSQVTIVQGKESFSGLNMIAGVRINSGNPPWNRNTQRDVFRNSLQPDLHPPARPLSTLSNITSSPPVMMKPAPIT